ncbi:MAG TPA: DUF1214 domain-containing protein, partial [Thermoleophilia bacterium]|nr:DUF1214 domain-containing protein [Thermoleophilia bacterium]
MKTPPLGQVLAMSGADFFAYGAELMLTHAPHPTDQPVLVRMVRLGIRPGERFSADGAGTAAAAAIAAAPEAAQRRMLAAEPRLNPVFDGWSCPRSGMGVYGTNYLLRAVIAKIGLGANLPEDAVYPVAYQDAHGEVPSGDNDYVLHFAADALPPADAFWSV